MIVFDRDQAHIPYMPHVVYTSGWLYSMPGRELTGSGSRATCVRHVSGCMSGGNHPSGRMENAYDHVSVLTESAVVSSFDQGQLDALLREALRMCPCLSPRWCKYPMFEGPGPKTHSSEYGLFGLETSDWVLDPSASVYRARLCRHLKGYSASFPRDLECRSEQTSD